MAIIEVDEIEFQEEIKMAFDRGDSVIIKFSSTYCDSCLMLGFELEELDERVDNLTILEVNISEAESLAQVHGIVEVPYMKIYKDSEHLIFDGVGIMLADDIEVIITAN